MYKNRIKKLQQLLIDNQSDGILISNFYNIYYFSGFKGVSPHEREASLFITPNKAYIVVPAMYQLQAKNLTSVQDNTFELAVDKERDGILTKFTNLVDTSKNFHFEGDDLTFREYSHINDKLNTNLTDFGNTIQKLRIIKDEIEIQKMKKAIQLTDKTYLELVNFLKNTDYTQLTEKDIANKIQNISESLGGDGLTFDTIVALGAGSAEPHYKTGNLKLQSSNILLLDFGITLDGYGGDLTRCLHLGPASEEIKQHYQIVLEANKKAIVACQPNKICLEIDKISRDVLAKYNVAEYFLHGLGHGIGLECHELPYIRPNSKIETKPGMTFSIEPGIYLEGKYGIRIEDLVLITKNGCEVLSSSPKEELIEI